MGARGGWRTNCSRTAHFSHNTAKQPALFPVRALKKTASLSKDFGFRAILDPGRHGENQIGATNPNADTHYADIVKKISRRKGIFIRPNE